MYRNATRGGLSQGHWGYAQKILCRYVQRFNRYARGQIDTQTDRQTDRNNLFPYQGGVKLRLSVLFIGGRPLTERQSC